MMTLVYRMIVSFGLVCVVASCGPKDVKEPEPAPPRLENSSPDDSDGPPKKLMPAEMGDQIENVFTMGRSQLERCYNDHVVATMNTKLRGSVTIAVKIGYTPRPTKVWFLKNTFTQEKLNNCFLKTVRSWRFPIWGGVMDYAFKTLSLEEM